MVTHPFDFKGASGDSSIHDYMPVRRDIKDASTLDLPCVITGTGFRSGVDPNDTQYHNEKSFGQGIDLNVN